MLFFFFLSLYHDIKKLFRAPNKNKQDFHSLISLHKLVKQSTTQIHTSFSVKTLKGARNTYACNKQIVCINHKTNNYNKFIYLVFVVSCFLLLFLMDVVVFYCCCFLLLFLLLFLFSFVVTNIVVVVILL